MTTIRNRSLDGLRGVAIALVLAHHATAFLWPGTFGHWLSGGFLGVDLFFVLSGYLITTLLLERRDKGEGLGIFYQRRLVRLMPALLLMLAVVVTVETIINPGVGSPAFTVVATLANLGNWLGGSHHFIAPVGIVWSLAVEEQFYLVWPITLFLLLRWGRSRRWILAAVIVTIAVIVAHRAQMWHHNPTWSVIYPRTDTRLDGLLVGAALALAAPNLRRIPRWILSTVASVGFVGFLAAAQYVRWDAGALYMGGFTVAAIVAAVLVAAVVDGRWGRFLGWRPLAGLGRVSYGVYLWHYPVFYIVAQHTAPDFAVRMSLGFGVTAILVAISWFALERPTAAALKRHLAGSRRPAVWPAPTSAVLSTP